MSAYPTELVEHLMPTVWDRTWAWGMQNPTAPDPDMPKSKYTSPKEATTWWCHLIDIRRAWEKAPLLWNERQALLLHYGLGWTHDEIAVLQEVSRRSVSKRLSTGIERLSDFLSV